jgi:predicted ester cyclase
VATNGLARVLTPLSVTKAYLGDHRNAALLAPNAILEAPGVPGRLCGREAITHYVDRLIGAVADDGLWIETGFESADRAVVAFRLCGTHGGRLWGVAPTGRSIELKVMALAHVHGGAIHHLRLSYDRLALREQVAADDLP